MPDHDHTGHLACTMPACQNAHQHRPGERFVCTLPTCQQGAAR